MSLESIISTYGYVAIFLGTLLEGETILVLGSFAAHQGYLHLPWVIASAFVGSLCGDQLYFYIGRHKGQTLLEKRPTWQAKSARIFSLLQHHPLWFILGFRFLYGLRTVAPFVIGASNIPPLRFLLLNCGGALIWATTIGILGFLFGYTLKIFIGDIKRYELWFFVAVAGIGMLLWSIHFISKKKA